MPISRLTFITTALLALVEIKSQGEVEFPFQTHPRAIMVAINCLLMYGFVSIIELVVHAARLDTLYAMTARLGRIVSLCFLPIVCPMTFSTSHQPVTQAVGTVVGGGFGWFLVVDDGDGGDNGRGGLRWRSVVEVGGGGQLRRSAVEVDGGGRRCSPEKKNGRRRSSAEKIAGVTG
ncbi:hypothetical protein OSB04_029651 [Centaurea solstitialis]|uniref:Uncharacterized protein n=1 Tax=Centaurea solstitialis TaxID=347529 RepID=A0AA38SRF5_9ASTR|nr:hypothetical protein OSB04_029651 [Centaurea solstitialis]